MVARSARSLDPWKVAPGAGLAMALAGALALAWALLAPRFAGEPVAPHLESFYFPSAWVLLGGLLALMSLGAAKRCFGFGWTSLPAIVLGVAGPLLAAGHLAPPMVGLAGLGAAFAGLLLRAPLARWRWWAGAMVGAFGLALVTIARVRWSLAPLPRDAALAIVPVVASWAAAGAGVGGGALVALTARRGQG